jgi:hypothetical protein
MTTAINSYLEAIETGTSPAADVFAAGVLFDATVPNWRFRLLGEERVRKQFGAWFKNAGQFDAVERTPLPDGELVRFELSWMENGQPWACHQSHHLTLDSEARIVGVTLFCGGRWPAPLLAEMEEALRVGA